MKYTYLIINILSVFFPFMFSFEGRISFYKNWKYLFPAMLFTALGFITWDIYFTHLGIWSFNKMYLTGFFIFNLPFEESMFFLAIPYASMFLYEVLCQKIFSKNSYNLNTNSYIPITISLILLIIACFNLNKLYTSSTFLLFAGLNIFLVIKKSQFLNRFYLFYLVLLLPFFIVNGLLTGSFLGRIVVQYNDLEILGLRILTIPVEDVVYGMLMMLLNISLYEYFKTRY